MRSIGITIYDSSLLSTSSAQKVKEHYDFGKIDLKSHTFTCILVR